VTSHPPGRRPRAERLRVRARRDFGFKLLTPSVPAQKTEKLNSEPANGRPAITTFIGMCFQDGLTGSPLGRLGLLRGLAAARLRVRARRYFGFKLLTSSVPAQKTKKLNAELANGRLAITAFIGTFLQDGLTGSPWDDWALFAVSQLRAVEYEFGATSASSY
jgi:hypothetical protein